MTDPTFAERSARAQADLLGEKVIYKSDAGWHLYSKDEGYMSTLDIDTDTGLLDAADLLNWPLDPAGGGWSVMAPDTKPAPQPWKGLGASAVVGIYGDNIRAAIKAAWVEYVNRSEGDVEREVQPDNGSG